MTMHDGNILYYILPTCSHTILEIYPMQLHTLGSIVFCLKVISRI